MENNKDELRIMLACAGGMSTSLLVTKMQKSAEARGVKAKIWATSVGSAKQTWQEADVLMIGPQVRFEMESLTKVIEGNIPFAVIDMRDYGMMNGEKVLTTALELLNIK